MLPDFSGLIHEQDWCWHPERWTQPGASRPAKIPSATSWGAHWGGRIRSLTNKVASPGSNMLNCVARKRSIYFSKASHSRKSFITLLLNVSTSDFLCSPRTYSWLHFDHWQTQNPPENSSLENYNSFFNWWKKVYCFSAWSELFDFELRED